MVSQLFYIVFMNAPMGSQSLAGRYLPAMVSKVPRTRILRFAQYDHEGGKGNPVTLTS